MSLKNGIDKIMSPLEIFAVIISVIGVVLTIRRHMWCWGVNLISYIIYGYLFFEYKLYGETILQVVFVFLGIYGFYHWSKTKKQDDEIRIEPIAIRRVLIHVVLTAIGGLVFGLSLHYFTDAALPLLDAQLAAFSLLGTYWTSRKHIATWVLWVFVDIIYTGMFFYKELYLTAVLYASFVGLAAWGWRQWVQVRQKQNSMAVE
jgi:nicotinamide mononucleotide transporter